MTFFSKQRAFLNNYILSISLLIASLGGVIAIFFTILLPSDAGQSLVLGLSGQRLILVFLDAVFYFFFMFFAFYLWKHPHIEKRIVLHLREGKKTPVLLSLSIVISIVFLGFAFLTPAYRFLSYGGYIGRLRPTILWMTLVTVQTVFLLFFILRRKTLEFSSKRTVLTFFSSLLLLWMFTALSGLGIKRDDRYWNETGVPILNEQIFIALLISIIFLFFSLWVIRNRQNSPVLAFVYKKKDFFIFFFLWAVTALIWVREPLPRNFFAPGPYPPNYDLSPFADSAAFDLGGQFSLLGQGLFNADFYARSLLSGFLALLHIIIGQNYLTVVALQTTIFASFVPVLYLIGKELHSRTAGVLVSLLFIFKNVNAIASSTWILSAHSKYMLTELPTGIMIALFALWFIRWQKKNGQRASLLVLSGGALGLGIMLRTNILFFLPLSITLFFLKFKMNWRETVRATLIFMLAFFITISPWMWRNQKVADNPFFFLDIITDVLETRYFLDHEENIPPHLQIQDESLVENKSARPNTRALVSNTVAEISLSYQDTDNEISPLVFIPNHFFHNLVTSVFILPTSPVLHDLRRTIKDIYPYWNRLDNQGWAGDLTVSAKIGLFWNLFLLALGLSAAWKKWHIASLVPLFSFLTYHLSNAFARTSGGRYLVPVDWVILLYYALGIIEIIFFIGRYLGFEVKVKEKVNRRSFISYKNSFVYILPFFLFVGTITILDQAPSPRYPVLESTEIKEKIIQGEYLQQSSVSEDELDIFLQDTRARIYIGRALYPRFYRIGEGEHSQGNDAFEDKNFPRLAFTMLGRFGQTGVVLPLAESPLYFPNATDVILVGCQHPPDGYLFPYVDALIVIVLDEDQEVVYTRAPETLLECPLPEPVCDGNRNCR